MSSSKADSFGTFLEMVNTVNARPTGNLATTSSPISIDVLKFVKDHGGTVSTVEILQNVKMPILNIASTLESLKNSNLIEVHVDGADENISLTSMGEKVADLT